MTEEIFTTIYTNNLWKNKESVSGGGSMLKNNKILLSMLENFVNNNNTNTYLDLACGDFNWMQHFDFSLLQSYTGIDIVEQLIILNNDKFKNDIVSFQHRNIIEDTIETVDAIMCKDCLFHFSYEDIFKTLKNIVASKSKYLITTTFPEHSNKDIRTGTWRQINLQVEPFNLPEPLLIWNNIENRKDSNKDKSIAIWKIKDIQL